jgi:hypothetical protein
MCWEVPRAGVNSGGTQQRLRSKFEWNLVKPAIRAVCVCKFGFVRSRRTVPGFKALAVPRLHLSHMRNCSPYLRSQMLEYRCAYPPLACNKLVTAAAG